MRHFRCAECGGINRVPEERLQEAPKCGRCAAPLDLKARPADIDDARLEKLIQKSPVPLLVDFWAPWCGPCKVVAPHLEQLAARHAGKLIVVKVNTDNHQRKMSELGIRGIPTLGLWHQGKMERLQPGAMGLSELESFVSPYLLVS